MFYNRNIEERPRKKRGCLWTFIVCLLLYFVFCGIMGMLFGNMFSTPETKVVDNSVYCLDMKGEVIEQGQEENPFASMMGSVPYVNQEETIGLDDILNNIRLAKQNDKIKGIYLKGGTNTT